jgi:hypothetical protein
MTMTAIDIGPHIRARSDIQEMLLDLDERVGRIELSWEYVRRLGREDWLALREVAGRNGVPLRVT